MTPKVEFHFDFGSPNAYFSHKVIPGIEQRTGDPERGLPARAGAQDQQKILVFQQYDSIADGAVARPRAWRSPPLRRQARREKVRREATLGLEMADDLPIISSRKG